jgi:hypothetical protein
LVVALFGFRGVELTDDEGTFFVAQIQKARGNLALADAIVQAVDGELEVSPSTQ